IPSSKSQIRSSKVDKTQCNHETKRKNLETKRKGLETKRKGLEAKRKMSRSKTHPSFGGSFFSALGFGAFYAAVGFFSAPGFCSAAFAGKLLLPPPLSRQNAAATAESLEDLSRRKRCLRRCSLTRYLDDVVPVSPETLLPP
nr:hypothetical protein [Tanacetum cinerariifolium]